MTLPTKEEIKAKLLEAKKDDMFGFEWQEYLIYLDWETAEEFFKEGLTEEEKQHFFETLCREDILLKMHDYMEFAWNKANNCRGISANRSMMHYIAWTWLAGDQQFSDEIGFEFKHAYEFYGKPILEKICNHYGWDYKQWDDGIRSNTEY